MSGMVRREKHHRQIRPRDSRARQRLAGGFFTASAVACRGFDRLPRESWNHYRKLSIDRSSVNA